MDKMEQKLNTTLGNNSSFATDIKNEVLKNKDLLVSEAQSTKQRDFYLGFEVSRATISA